MTIARRALRNSDALTAVGHRMNPLPAINPVIVRAYDLRGTVGHELSRRDAFALGLAYATVARAQDRTRIAVARDGRLSSPQL